MQARMCIMQMSRSQLYHTANLPTAETSKMIMSAMQAKSLGMTTVLIQSKTMLEETGYTLERYVLINISHSCQVCCSLTFIKNTDTSETQGDLFLSGH